MRVSEEIVRLTKEGKATRGAINVVRARGRPHGRDCLEDRPAGQSRGQCHQRYRAGAAGASWSSWKSSPLPGPRPPRPPSPRSMTWPGKTTSCATKWRGCVIVSRRSPRGDRVAGRVYGVAFSSSRILPSSSRQTLSSPTFASRCKRIRERGTVLEHRFLRDAVPHWQHQLAPSKTSRVKIESNSFFVHPPFEKKFGLSTKMHFLHFFSPRSILSRRLSPTRSENSSYQTGQS